MKRKKRDKKKKTKFVFYLLGAFLLVFGIGFGFFFTQGLQTVTQELDKTFEVSEAISGDYPVNGSGHWF